MKTTDTFEAGTTRTVSMDTKKTKDSKSVHHTVTFDFSGCTVEHVMGLALDAGKVKLQSRIRKNMGDYRAATIDIKVATLGDGRSSGITPEHLKAYIAALSDKEKVAQGLMPA